MKVLVATLADYANVREGLLNVVSGGLAQFMLPAFPGEAGFWVAAIVEVPTVPGGEIRIVFSGRIEDADGLEIGRVEGEVGGQFADTADVELPTNAPLAIPVRTVLPHAGVYTLTLEVAGTTPTILTFRAVDLSQPADVEGSMDAGSGSDEAPESSASERSD